MAASRRPLDPRKVPQQERSRRTQERILQAGARVFGAGYATATTDRIAREAGLSVGSLYQYFPNKDAVLLALAHEHVTTAESVLEQALGSAAPLSDWLAGLTRAVHDLHAADPELHRVILDQAPRTPELLERFQRIEAWATDRVAERFRGDATVTVDDPDTAARIVTATIESLTHRFIGQCTPDESRRLTDQMLEMLISYLCGRGWTSL